MIVISRYTNDGQYPAFAARLRESCTRFGLHSSIQLMASSSEWHNVDVLKPHTILQELLAHRKSVCWMDADCEIVEYPTLLLDPACDFACYNWTADADNTIAADYNPQQLVCSGGVLFFRYTAAAIELVLRWNSECLQNDGNEGSDPPLNRAFNNARPPVKTLWLPKNYNRMDSHWPHVPPVINHVFRDRAHKEMVEA